MEHPENVAIETTIAGETNKLNELTRLLVLTANDAKSANAFPNICVSMAKAIEKLLETETDLVRKAITNNAVTPQITEAVRNQSSSIENMKITIDTQITNSNSTIAKDANIIIGKLNSLQHKLLTLNDTSAFLLDENEKNSKLLISQREQIEAEISRMNDDKKNRKALGSKIDVKMEELKAIDLEIRKSQIEGTRLLLERAVKTNNYAPLENQQQQLAARLPEMEKIVANEKSIAAKPKSKSEAELNLHAVKVQLTIINEGLYQKNTKRNDVTSERRMTQG